MFLLCFCYALAMLLLCVCSVFAIMLLCVCYVFAMLLLCFRNWCLQCVHVICIFQCKCYNQHSRSPQFMPNVFMPYVVHNRNTIMNTSAALKSCQHCVHIVCNLQWKRYDDQFLNTQFMDAWSGVRTKCCNCMPRTASTLQENAAKLCVPYLV